MNYLFTSESVSEGHPDKVSDQISDAILDEFLRQDPEAKVACETFCSTGLVVVGGEVRSDDAYVDIPKTVRRVINKIGYNKAEYMFDGNSCGILSALHEQSADINRGVVGEDADAQGAGDQGMMFGYASDETPALMPATIYYAHKLVEEFARLRKSDPVKYKYLRPDSKSQVSIRYRDGKPVAVESIVLSHQHTPDMPIEWLEALTREVAARVIPAELMKGDIAYYVNPTGRFEIGGPHGDTGLTGRKIIVDTYGGVGSHGGGAFSGKDPSKVDRSAAYFCRYAAKNIVAAGLARKCEIQVAYAIGVAKPLSVNVDTYGTGVVDDARLAAIVAEVFDFRPAAIVETLQLKRPNGWSYQQTAAYGHFGRDIFPWEKTDRTDDLRKAAGVN